MRCLFVASLVLTLVSGCVIARIEAVDANGNLTPVTNATIYIRECSSCTWKVMAHTTSDGYYVYDGYENGAIVPPGFPSNDTYELYVYTPGYSFSPWSVYHKPDWQLYSSTNEYYTLIPTIYVANYANAADADQDNIADFVEFWALQTNFSKTDSDDDGLADGTEYYGMEWVDYSSMGVSPNHKDLLVEADYEVVNGIGGFPTPTILGEIAGVFRGVDVGNPDGANGINLILAKNTQRTAGSPWTCETTASDWDFGPFQHPRTMRYGKFCAGTDGGKAFLPNQGYLSEGTPFVVETNWNQDPNDDLTEIGIPSDIGLIVHEVGHTLWLTHGGGHEGVNSTIADQLNWKPNYPSVMNYEYISGVDGYSSTLPHTVGFSHGQMNDIDTAALVELGVIQSGDGSVLGTGGGYDVCYACTTAGTWDVDWDSDDYEAGSYSYNIPGCNEYYPVLRDYDDHAAMEEGLAQGIPLFVQYSWNNITKIRDRGVTEPTDYFPQSQYYDTPGPPRTRDIKKSAPMPASGLSGADDTILSRFTKRHGAALGRLLKQLGLDGQAASALANTLYRQSEYVDPSRHEEKLRAALTARLSREAGEHVEVTFVDCEPASLSELDQLVRRYVTKKTGDRERLRTALAETRSVELCR